MNDGHSTAAEDLSFVRRVILSSTQMRKKSQTHHGTWYASVPIRGESVRQHWKSGSHPEPAEEKQVRVSASRELPVHRGAGPGPDFPPSL